MSWLLNQIIGDSPSKASKVPTTVHSGALVAAEYEQKASQVGLLVTQELDDAINKCKSKVDMISADCRRRNRRYRDIEFDLLDDTSRTIFSLSRVNSEVRTPLDIRRVPDIFENPQFFVGGISSNDIRQGGLGDCWFLSALATVSARPDLIEKICVARDEPVGVYGFIFFTDFGWVDIVIDDYLAVKVSKFEELSSEQKQLYKNDADFYERTVRKGSKTLSFSSSTDENETWVPLLEKAYAKLHGDYSALSGGNAGDAIEALTGGIGTEFYLSDIFDPEAFWTQELSAVKNDHLFECSIVGVNSPYGFALSNGLFTGHSYAVMGICEVNDKRFVKIRNPWAASEWTGRWGDGSKEWTTEWLQLLPALNHQFGNDGEFLMEYTDFLRTWTMSSKTRLLDSTWVLSTHWLNVAVNNFPSPWSYGDVSFTITIQESTPAIIVLARADTRSWSDIQGPYVWSFDFNIYRKGEKTLLGSSTHDWYYKRSVTLELSLTPGEYVVHVRLDRDKRTEPSDKDDWIPRKLARVVAAKSASFSLATNFRPSDFEGTMPFSPTLFPGRNITEIELEQHTNATIVPAESSQVLKELPEAQIIESTAKSPTEALFKGSPEESREISQDHSSPKSAVTATQALSATPADSPAKQKGGEDVASTESVVKAKTSRPSSPSPSTTSTSSSVEKVVHEGYSCDVCKTSPIVGARYRCLETECVQFDLCPKCMNSGLHPSDHKMLRYGKADEESRRPDSSSEDEGNNIVLGLRVYTQLYAPAIVKGQLRHGRVLRHIKKSTDK